MSSKRGQQSASASKEPKRLRATPAHVPAPATIDSLPRHLLTEVFSYAPPAARLKAVSLVCKRWRTAALHACDTLVWRSFDRKRPELALLPSLTDLSITHGVLSHATLPASLRKLTLDREALLCASNDAERGVDTFLAHHLPNLTELHLHYEFPVRPFAHGHLLSFLNATPTRSPDLSSSSMPNSLGTLQSSSGPLFAPDLCFAFPLFRC